MSADSWQLTSVTICCLLKILEFIMKDPLFKWRVSLLTSPMFEFLICNKFDTRFMLQILNESSIITCKNLDKMGEWIIFNKPIFQICCKLTKHLFTLWSFKIFCILKAINGVFICFILSLKYLCNLSIFNPHVNLNSI